MASSLQNEKALLTLTSGLLAGASAAFSLVCVPSILAGSDPLPVWKTVYNRGMKLAVSNILVTGVTGLWLFSKTKDKGYLVVSTLVLLIPPWTGVAMMKTNNALHAIDEGKKEEKKEFIRALVKKWGKLQAVRTLLGVGGFVGAIWVTRR